MILLFVLVLSFNALAVEQVISLQGKADYQGELIYSGDIRVTIYDAPTGGTLVYDSGSNFNGAIIDGYFDVMLGEVTTLDLNYNQYYYLDIEMKSDTDSVWYDIDWEGNERKKFESVSGDTIANDLQLNNGSLFVCAGGNCPVPLRLTPSYEGDLYIENNVEIGKDMFVDDDTLVVDSTTDRVGINTVSPQKDLHVLRSGAVGTVRVEGGTDYITDYRSDGITYTGNQDFNIKQDTNSVLDIHLDSIKLYTGDTERMRIDSSGHVGINNINPAYQLDVDGDGVRVQDSNFFVDHGSYTGSWARGFVIQNSDASQRYGLTGHYDSDTLQRLRIGKYSDDGKGIYWLPSGMVGIGNPDPTYVLDVNGNGRFMENIIVNDGNRNFDTIIRGDNDPNLFYADASEDRVGLGVSAPQNKLDVEGSAAIGTAYSGTNAAPANGLLVEGRVGIGTPNPSAKLEVLGQDVEFFSGTATQNMKIGRSDNENIHFYVSDGGAHMHYDQDETDGTDHDFTFDIGSASSGSADWIFSSRGSEKARITEGGRLGVGTDSPSHKLHIAGNVQVDDSLDFTPTTRQYHNGTEFIIEY